MSRFNEQSQGTRTVNLADGDAYSQTPEMELVSILLTSFAKDEFYRSGEETFDHLKKLIEKCDKRFVAQAIVFARTKFGMRSITHVAACELAKYLKGEKWAGGFYNAVIHRPDDMTEIVSYYYENCADSGTGKRGKKTLTKAMKQGLGYAFTKFDRYALAKYRGDGKAFKLVDVANLVHPVPANEENRKDIGDLVKGDLVSFDTWEVELSKACQGAQDEAQKAILKKQVWYRLISERKIGYFALLRNLRNIIEQAPEVIDQAMAMLTDPALIRKSLVLPFRYTTAFEEIKKLNDGKIVRMVLMNLNMAVDIAVQNVPKFEGETLVVLDTSGSMTTGEGRPAKIGALFAAIMIKACNADFMNFSDDAHYFNVNPMDSTITIANSIHFQSGGTNFHSIFQTANKHYDRIIILSDMQGWVLSHENESLPTAEYNEYKRVTGANPKIYSFDLAGYGSMQFPQRNIYCIAGFSEKVFDLMKALEEDKDAMINQIKTIGF